jgi:hypothetical protein
MPRRFLLKLCVVALLANAGTLRAEEQTKQEVVDAEVADCTARALSWSLGPEELLDWVTPCAKRATDLCALLSVIESRDEDCAALGQTAWKGAADQIKARLVQRWQACAVPEDVRSDMIQRIEQTDAAVHALYTANCGYDAAQWRAHDRPDIAAKRESRCLADGETARTWLHYWNFVRDAGCEATTPSP